jgi:hypothetical protein
MRWIQNSYGGSYCWLPFAVEPWCTFIANSQKLWFDRQGDGKTKDTFGYTAPDGCLVDAASLTKRVLPPGRRPARHPRLVHGSDGRGVLLQSELPLISARCEGDR